MRSGSNTRHGLLRLGSWGLIAACCLADALPVLASGSASFQGLGDIPGGAFQSQAFAISADGTTVVGTGTGPDQVTPGSFREGFRWRAEEGMVRLRDLHPSLLTVRPQDVSGDGTVLVGNNIRWSETGAIETLTDLTGTFTTVSGLAISADATTIAGVGFLAPPQSGTAVFRWTQATGVVDLGALANDLGFLDAGAFDVSSDGTALTGQSMSFAFNVEPIHWTQAGGLIGLGDVPGGEFYALGLGISGDGNTVVGGARTALGSPGTDEAFVWRQAIGFQLLDPQHGAQFGSTAWATSHDGSIVVGYDGNVGGAMMWDEQHGVRSIQQVLVNEFGVDLSGWTLLNARDVSADGTTIVGTGINPQGNEEAWIARIPRGAMSVPASAPALRAGLVVLLLLMGVLAVRRARRTAAGPPVPPVNPPGRES